jgi:hypothetical protein
VNSNEIFEKIRALNVRALAKAVKDRTPCRAEMVIRDADGAVAVEGEFNLPCRVDVIPIDKNRNLMQSVMVEPPTTFDFDGIKASVAGVPLLIEPFSWDYAQFIVSFPRAPNNAPLLAWFWSWFDPDDKNAAGADGLHGVVHYLADPEFAKGKLDFVVDFGSAPVTAIESLMGVLVEMGATRISVE